MREGTRGSPPHRAGRPPGPAPVLVNKFSVKPALPFMGFGFSQQVFWHLWPHMHCLPVSRTPERYRSAHLLTTAPVVLCSRFPVSIAKLEAHGKMSLRGSERSLRGLSALRGCGDPVTKSPLSKSAPPAPKYRFLSSYGSGMGGALRHTPQRPLVIGQN